MGEMGMGRSSSEGMLASLAEGAEGKRRKLSEESALRRTKEVVEKEVVGDVEMGENEEGVVDGANGVSGSGKGVGRDVATAVGTTGSIARPSPLWQSSKAGSCFLLPISTFSSLGLGDKAVRMLMDSSPTQQLHRPHHRRKSSQQPRHQK